MEGKEVTLKFNLPSFKRPDIKVRLSKESVSVNAERKVKQKIKRKSFNQETTSIKHFSYTTSVPKIKPKKEKVDFKKGILTIKAPRA